MASLITEKIKYRQVGRRIQEAIGTGRYKSGQRLPTEKDLIKQYACSRSTILRALLDLEYRGVIERRRGSGTYVKEKMHQKTLGLIAPRLRMEAAQTSIFPFFERYLAEQAQKNKLNLLCEYLDYFDNPKEEDMMESVRRLISQEVEGVFLFPRETGEGKSDEVDQRTAKILSDAGIPIVLLDHDIYDFPKYSGLDIVSANNRRGGFLLADHLWEKGCRRIVFASDYTMPATVSERIAGYQDGLRAHGADIDNRWVHLSGTRDISEQYVRTLVEQHKPDGIICKADNAAALVMRHLIAMGVRVGKDIMLAGFDDSPITTLLPVPLTTIRQPIEGMVHSALQMMLDRIAKPDQPARQILVDCDLIVRESTGVKRP